MQDSTRTRSQDDPQPGSDHHIGAVPHRQREVPCPACGGMGLADIGVRDVHCRHCDADGTVSPSKAKIIQRQVEARSTAPVG